MTYEESYRKCESLEDLHKEVNSDVVIAKMYGSQDRIEAILKAANKVANEKFKECKYMEEKE